MASFSQNYSISGLETLTIASIPAGLYTLRGKIQLPRLSQSDASDPNYNTNYPSQVVATIKQNGTTVFTTQAGADGFLIPMPVAAGDSWTVQLSSSQSTGQPDQILNNIKAVVSVG